MSTELRNGEQLPLRSQEDIVLARQVARTWSIKAGFSLVDQTKIVTATSELARNALVHGGGGELQVEQVERNGRRGLQLTFADRGPGIPDIQQAMRDGYTTNGGMGLGLSGSKRLMNEFAIESAVGQGTRVVIVKWI
jgi:serine/threonine-protein kinase RsbT